MFVRSFCVRCLSRIHAVMNSRGATESAERRGSREHFNAGNRSPSGDWPAFHSNVPFRRPPRLRVNLSPASTAWLRLRASPEALPGTAGVLARFRTSSASPSSSSGVSDSRSSSKDCRSGLYLQSVMAVGRLPSAGDDEKRSLRAAGLKPVQQTQDAPVALALPAIDSGPGPV